MKYSFIISIFIAFALNLIDAKHCAKFPFNARPDDCCVIPQIHDEQIFQGCLEKYGKFALRVITQYSGEGPFRGTCVSECIRNVTGTRDISHDDLMEMTRKAIEGLPEWSEMPEKVDDYCSKLYLEKENELIEGNNFPPLKPNDPHCDPRFDFEALCVVKVIMNNCPDEHKTDSKKCKKLFNFYKTCNL